MIKSIKAAKILTMTSDHYKLAAFAIVVAILTSLISINGLGKSFLGENLANASIYLLLIGVLVVAVARRSQILSLQAEIVRKQGQEIGLFDRRRWDHHLSE